MVPSGMAQKYMLVAKVKNTNGVGIQGRHRARNRWWRKVKAEGDGREIMPRDDALCAGRDSQGPICQYNLPKIRAGRALPL